MTHVLQSIPPDNDGDPVLALHGDALSRRRQLRWFGYLSTTGVYGDRGGDWVDEPSDLQPAGERGRWRVAAEVDWSRRSAEACRCTSSGSPASTGPAGAPLDSLRAGSGQRVIKPGQVFSRIHVEDIAQVLRASMARPESRRRSTTSATTIRRRRRR